MIQEKCRSVMASRFRLPKFGVFRSRCVSELDRGKRRGRIVAPIVIARERDVIVLSSTERAWYSQFGLLALIVAPGA